MRANMKKETNKRGRLVFDGVLFIREDEFERYYGIFMENKRSKVYKEGRWYRFDVEGICESTVKKMSIGVTQGNNVVGVELNVESLGLIEGYKRHIHSRDCKKVKTERAYLTRINGSEWVETYKENVEVTRVIDGMIERYKLLKGRI